MAYATVAQYVRRFGTVTDVDRLEECLDDATAAIDSALDAHGIDHAEPSEDLADRLMRVCRSVAQRLMPASGDVPPGLTQLSVTSGNYNENVTFAASYGLPKLLPSELAMLGIGGRARTLMPRVAGDFGEGGGDAL